jgi:Flp pilus assembly protein TadG
MPSNFLSSMLVERLRRFAGDRSGNILILFSLSLPVVIGLAALGSEGGSLYLKKTELQAVADQAAISAANSLNSSATAYTIEGKAVAAAMGYVDGQNGVTVTVNSRRLPAPTPARRAWSKWSSVRPGRRCFRRSFILPTMSSMAAPWPLTAADRDA